MVIFLFLQVNTASRMESTSEPMRIQITETTARELAKDAGHWLVEPRGSVEVKGKDRMNTFWLICEN